MINAIRIAVVLTITSLSVPVFGEEPLDGPNARFSEPLLDHLVGKWELGGRIAGQEAHYRVEADWVLNHQFLRIHQKQSVPSEKGEAPYEAIVYIGYDHMSEKAVAHWIDVFGGRASETLGYGSKKNSTMEFVFEYPEAPFRTTFEWIDSSKSWHWTMRTRTKSGNWITFGDVNLKRLQ
jgi:hypothetical protein